MIVFFFYVFFLKKIISFFFLCICSFHHFSCVSVVSFFFSFSFFLLFPLFPFLPSVPSFPFFLLLPLCFVPWSPCSSCPQSHIPTFSTSPVLYFSAFQLFHFSTFPFFHFSIFPLFHFSTFPLSAFCFTLLSNLLSTLHFALCTFPFLINFFNLLLFTFLPCRFHRFSVVVLKSIAWQALILHTCVWGPDAGQFSLILSRIFTILRLVRLDFISCLRILCNFLSRFGLQRTQKHEKTRTN